ncbi:MAG TPA: ShlB/FhaC/HecB family hemolysin secretion/activation protein, partial [Chloroflexota bacterium]|nr:ShlB/FhaC/HecB family hemolysin secretion/activation protein [Chloroflexota bacterium]
LGDRTIFSVFSTADFHEQQTIQVGHEMRLGPQGLTLGGTFTYAWARPSVANAHVLAKTLLGNVEVGYPVVRREATTLRGSVGMDIVNQNVWLDEAALTRDRLRVAYMRLGLDAITPNIGSSFSTAEPPWRMTALLELRQGLHALGASRDCGPAGVNCLGPGDVPPSRLEGRSDATLLRFTGLGEFRPVPKLTFALGARAQYSGQPLLSFEDFAAGNYTVGRGYDPGALLGDSGFGTQAEIRYGSKVPISATKPAVEGYAFWDHANVSHHDSPIIISQREHLNSVGAGARINWDRFVADAGLAFPLTRVGPFNRKPPVRFLVSLTTRLWPWKY